MRNLVIAMIVAIAGLTSCGPNNQFNITGNITGIDSGQIYLQKREAGEWKVLDSSSLDAGKFKFQGTIDSPEMWYLKVKDTKLYLPLFVENAKITVEILSDSIEGSTIKGSFSQDVYGKYLKQMEPLTEEMNAIYMRYRAARDAEDEAGMAAADSMYEAADLKQKEMILAFAADNSTSVVAPYLIYRNGYMFDLSELEEAVQSMDTTLNSSTYMQELTKSIEILKAVQIGQPAPDFTQADTAGNPVTLSSLRGNVLLVDFWASWCGPCRAENPNVVAAWEKYHKKGFDIIGVSLDNDRDAWITAIHDDNLTWNQVSDLQYWSNEVSTLYGIRSIPSNVLLDQEGVIVARNLRGDELLNKLEELLGPAK